MKIRTVTRGSADDTPESTDPPSFRQRFTRDSPSRTKGGTDFNFDLSGRDSFILTGEAAVSTNDLPSDQIPPEGKIQALFSQMG